MSRLLDELNEYKESCLDDRGYVIESKAEDLVFQSAEAIERYERIIHAIANIDTLFYNLDGTERDWNDKEALTEIEKLVTPVWNEHCEQSWEKHRRRAMKKIRFDANFDNLPTWQTVSSIVLAILYPYK